MLGYPRLEPQLDDLQPWLVDVCPLLTAISQSGWDSLFVTGGYLYNGGKLNNAAINSEINFDVQLAPGTWTFEMLTDGFSDHPIVSVQVDGVTQGTVDLYRATAVSNLRSSLSGLPLARGKRRLRLVNLSKNASSSGYQVILQHIQLRRTGA